MVVPHRQSSTFSPIKDVFFTDIGLQILEFIPWHRRLQLCQVSKEFAEYVTLKRVKISRIAIFANYSSDSLCCFNTNEELKLAVCHQWTSTVTWTKGVEGRVERCEHDDLLKQAPYNAYRPMKYCSADYIEKFCQVLEKVLSVVSPETLEYHSLLCIRKISTILKKRCKKIDVLELELSLDRDELEDMFPNMQAHAVNFWTFFYPEMMHWNVTKQATRLCIFPWKSVKFQEELLPNLKNFPNLRIFHSSQGSRKFLVKYIKNFLLTGMALDVIDIRVVWENLVGELLHLGATVHEQDNYQFYYGSSLLIVRFFPYVGHHYRLVFSKNSTDKIKILDPVISNLYKVPQTQVLKSNPQYKNVSRFWEIIIYIFWLYLVGCFILILIRP